MKILIKESQYKKLTEQSVLPDVSSKTKSKIKAGANTLLKALPELNPLTISYNFLKLGLSTLGISNMTKIRLVFPQADWEVTATKLFKSLGIITGVFTSLDEAKKYCKTLISKGVKADEFVIGSHGNGKNLLMTKTSPYGYTFDVSFLESFKPLIAPNTKVFFTACNGADYLLTLKNAADVLGVTTYGSQGIYNPTANQSENGFYWCSTKPTKKFDITNDEILKPYTITPYGIISDIWIPNLDKNEVDVKVTIDPKLFGINIIPKNIRLTSQNRPKIINYDKNNQPIEAYSFNLDTSNLIDEKKYNELSKKGIKGSLSEYFTKIITNNITNGRVKIEFVTKNGLIPITSLKPLNVKSKNDVTNDYLLKNKICGKMSSSPISWL